jgi:hypothetical protein
VQLLAGHGDLFAQESTSRAHEQIKTAQFVLPPPEGLAHEAFQPAAIHRPSRNAFPYNDA